MKFLALITFALFSFSIAAQDINSAINVFNEGNQELQAGNQELALQKYKEAHQIASKLGDEGADIVAAASKQIPTLYYQLGVKDYKDKNTDKAIEEFQNAIKAGEEFGDAETVQKSREIIPKLYFAKGNDLFKDDNFDGAMTNFNLAVELDPAYSRPYFGQGLVYNKQGNITEMDKAFKKSRELAIVDGDQAFVDRINSTGKRFLQTEGINSLQAQKWNDAIKYLVSSNEYESDKPDTFYYLALAYNGQSKWAEAAAAAQQGVDLSAAESNDTKAKFYFELGNAHKGAGDTDKACEAYKNAKFGKFVENANYEITTVLKCN